MGVSIAVAVGVYGVSFGALGVAAGLSVWQAVALSMLMFTGGSQFAFIGVIAGGLTGWFLPWGINSINAMIVGVICYLIGAALQKTSARSDGRSGRGADPAEFDGQR